MKYRALLLVLVLNSFLQIEAQEITNEERWRMNGKALSLIQAYEQSSHFAVEDDKYDFLRLFEDSGKKIFCDLFDQNNFLKDISVADYADYLLRNAQNVSVTVKDLKKKGIRLSKDEWVYTVSFKKVFSYCDKNLVFFPLDEPRDFELEIDISFKTPDSDGTISAIRCINAKEYAPISNQYVICKNITEKEGKIDQGVTINGKKLLFNVYDQASSPKGPVKYWDDDINIVVEPVSVNGEVASTGIYELVQLRYTPKHFRLRVRNEYSPSAYSISSNSDLKKAASWGYNIGFDLGYLIPIGAVKVGAFSGLAIAFSQLSFQTNSAQYSYPTTDSKKVSYERLYDISSASQGVRFSDLMVPLYVSLETKVSSKARLIADFGGKAYFNTNAKVNPFSIDGAVYGDYGNGVIMDSGGDNFGAVQASFNEFLSAVSFRRQSIDYTAFGCLGVDFDIYNGKAFVEMKLGYEAAFEYSYKSSENQFFNNQEGIFPYVYSGYLGRDVVVRPLADCVSFKRQGFWANIGIMLKF